jgi:hypothetical protein
MPIMAGALCSVPWAGVGVGAGTLLIRFFAHWPLMRPCALMPAPCLTRGPGRCAPLLVRWGAARRAETPLVMHPPPTSRKKRGSACRCAPLVMRSLHICSWPAPAPLQRHVQRHPTTPIFAAAGSRVGLWALNLGGSHEKGAPRAHRPSPLPRFAFVCVCVSENMNLVHHPHDSTQPGLYEYTHTLTNAQ